MPSKAYLDKLRVDPEKWAEYKRKQSDSMQRWKQNNPEKYAECRRIDAENRRNKRAILKSDPAQYEEYKRQSREYSNKSYAADPAGMAKKARERRNANLEEAREKSRNRYADNLERGRGYARVHAERRKAIRVKAKIGQKCECGIDNPMLLEFHHIDPSEKGGLLAKANSWSEERILNEIAKCKVMCANCHRIHTWLSLDRSGTSYTSASIGRKRNLVSGIKAEIGCRGCHINDFRCLDFHHLDPSTKLFSIGAAISRGVSMERILAEITKCEVLCANCHKLEHLG